MRNQAQLIAYVDRLAGSFDGLTRLLEGPLSGAFGGVHILPFFDPIDGADAGFDPIDHLRVDPRLGTWQDVEQLGSTLPVMADLIVNHISDRSPQFRDFLAHADASPYAGMFLHLDRVFADGATEADLLAIYRPRPGLPLTPVTLADRSRRIMWTTFTSHQIDLDVDDHATLAYHDLILDTFQQHGIRMVRLDAVGYAVKTPGTTSFMTAETFAFIDGLTQRAHERGIEVLVEVHAHWRRQVEIARRVDRVYDFALPPLVLHALYTGRVNRLAEWMRIRPDNAVTVLDTHDGIGVIDVGPDANQVEHLGLLSADEIDELVDGIHEASRGTSLMATGNAASNVDLYQVNCTFRDAVGRDDDALFIARLIQVWLPGIPQVYYVGLLGGVNDTDLLEATGVGRDVNRHYYEPAELSNALELTVVRAQLSLLRVRNAHPAFDGTFSFTEESATSLQLTWTTPQASASLHVDLARRTFVIELSEPGSTRRYTDLAGLAEGS